MDLLFKARAICQIEKEGGKGLLEIVSEYSISNLKLFIKHGSYCSDNEALDKIDEYIDNGGDPIELYADILEKVNDSGFLSKGVDLTPAIQKIRKIGSSGKSGKEEKPKQSV
jgi:hypothetical protein